MTLFSRFRSQFSQPYILLAILAVLFGMVVVGLIPIGNGYIVDAQCTEGGRYVLNNGVGCGGYEIFGLGHFFWRPGVTIAAGFVLLAAEALVWAALVFGAVLALVGLARVGFARQAFSPVIKQKAALALIAGLLLTVHFSAPRVRSAVLGAEATCATSSFSALCGPCPGVVGGASGQAPKIWTDAGWPLHVSKYVYATDYCGSVPQRVSHTVDFVALVLNMTFWTVYSFGVINWFASGSLLAAGKQSKRKLK